MSAQASSKAKAVHAAKDCTKPGCPPQSSTSDIAVTRATRAQGKPFTGAQVVVAPATAETAVVKSSRDYSGLVLIAGILAIVALVAVTVLVSRRKE